MKFVVSILSSWVHMLYGLVCKNMAVVCLLPQLVTGEVTVPWGIMLF
jgi:hypothetical protein